MLMLITLGMLFLTRNQAKQMYVTYIWGIFELVVRHHYKKRPVYLEAWLLINFNPGGVDKQKCTFFIFVF